MNLIQPINKKLFDIYMLFTREPFVRYFTRELEFYSNGNGEYLGLISLDLTDNNYSTIIFSRDKAKQYRAIKIEVDIETIEEARIWIKQQMNADLVYMHDDKNELFDLFRGLRNKKQIHPHFEFLRDNISFSPAKEVIMEVSFHYNDIDGNFIDQFQSLNGFDSRVWELFLFCFFREQFFSFNRNSYAPDYMIEKLGDEIAVEAVIISRKTKSVDFQYKDLAIIEERLKNEIPLLYGSALFDKMKKKYWEKSHVKGKPFAIAIADFHDTMSMTWTYTALSEYLYGYTYEHTFDDSRNLVVKPVKKEDYTKSNGAKIPSGFFFQLDSEHISAIIFSTCGTLSKFNRIGKQAGLGSEKVNLVRRGTCYNHEPNATEPNIFEYLVGENCGETWSEGVIIYHNPNANNPINPDLFDDRVAQCYFRDKIIYSDMPEVFPYSNTTQNIIIEEK